MQKLYDQCLADELGERLPSGAIGREDAYARLGFNAHVPADRPYVVVNMVATVDGKVVIGGPGTTRLIGSATDHLLMTRIEGQCDAVLFGAALLRNDNPGYPFHDEARQNRRIARGVRPEPLWIGLSTRAVFDRMPRLFEGGPERTALFAGSEIDNRIRSQLEPHTHLVVANTPSVDLRLMLGYIRTILNVRVLCCLGGPAVNAAMLTAGLVDEVFVTIAPKIQNGRNPVTMFEGEAFAPASLARLRLLAVHAHEDELYLRYRTEEHIDATDGSASR